MTQRSVLVIIADKTTMIDVAMEQRDGPQVNERPSDLLGKSNLTAVALFRAISGFMFC
jgi:hypothetical protein